MEDIQTRILVPCDFSASAHNALKLAQELAAGVSGEVVVLSVVEERDLVASIPETAAGHRKKFSQWVQDIHDKEVPLRFEVRFGNTLPTLLEWIRSEKASLVVMGTKGSRGWDGYFTGSITEKVVKTSPVPVLAVKGTVSGKRIRNIVFPYNLWNESPETLAKIKKMQAFFKARLHLLQIDTEGNKDAEALAEKLETRAREHAFTDYVVNIRKQDGEREGIIQFAREINADMIAMITHGNRDLAHVYKSSITADVVNHAHVPVWTCSY